MSLPPFLSHLLTDMGVATTAPDHLLLNAIALGVIGILLVLGIGYLVLSLFREKNPGSIRDTLLTIGLGALGIVAVWWMLLTPFDRLPFAPPASSSGWGIFPAPVYGVVAVLVHGILLVLGSLTLTVCIMSLLDDLFAIFRHSDAPVFTDVLLTLALVLGLALPVGVWQYQHWPGWLVVPGEVIAALVLPILIIDVLRRPAIRRKKPELPHDLYRVDYLLFAGDYALRFFGIGVVILFHDTGPFVLTFTLVFFALTLLDDVAYYVSAYIRPARNPLSPFHWLGTIPCVLGLAVLGVGGWIAYIATNPRLTGALWLECCATASVYLLFKALRDHAKDMTGRRDREMQELKESRLPGFLGDLFKANKPEPEPAKEKSAETIRPFGLDPDGDITLPIEKPSPAPVEVTFARSVASELHFPAQSIFLLAGIGFHYLFIGTGVTTILQSGLALLAFGLLPLLATLLTVVNLPILETPKYVATLLIYVILILAGINTGFVIGQVGDQFAPVLGASGASLAHLDGDAILILVHAFAEEALVLATAGQILYLFGYMAAVILVDQDQLVGKDRAGWLELAEWHESQGDDDKAIEAYQNATQVDEQNALPWLRIAIIHFYHERYIEALDAITAARRLAPDSPTMYYWYSAIHYEQGHYRLALVAIVRAVSLAPHDISYLEAAARLYIVLEEYDRAEDAYLRALEVLPADAYLWYRLAYVQHDFLHKHAEALRAIESAISLSHRRSLPQAWLIRGEILRTLGREDEARLAFEHVLAIVPRAGRTASQLNLVAYTYLRLGRYIDALASIDQAIALEPFDGDYRDSRGEILMEMGPDQYAEALAEFDRALQFSPYLIESLVKKARILRLLGREEEAEAVEARIHELLS